MSKFKSGPFRLVIEKQVKIVPVTLLDNWRLFPDDGKQLGMPGRTRAIVHEVIDPTGLSEKDTEQLKNRVYDIIDSALRKSYASTNNK